MAWSWSTRPTRSSSAVVADVASPRARSAAAARRRRRAPRPPVTHLPVCRAHAGRVLVEPLGDHRATCGARRQRGRVARDDAHGRSSARRAGRPGVPAASASAGAPGAPAAVGAHGVPADHGGEVGRLLAERAQRVGDLVEPVVEHPLGPWLTGDDEAGQHVVLGRGHRGTQAVEPRERRAGALRVGSAGSPDHCRQIGAERPPVIHRRRSRRLGPGVARPTEHSGAGRRRRVAGWPSTTPRAMHAVALTVALVAIDSVNPGLAPGAAGEDARRRAPAGPVAAQRLRDPRRHPARVAPTAQPGRGRPGGRPGTHRGAHRPPRHRGRRGHGRLRSPPRSTATACSDAAAADMKAGVAALVVAAEELGGARLAPGRVVLALVADEEDASLGTEAVLEALPGLGIQPDVALVGEPTWLAARRDPAGLRPRRGHASPVGRRTPRSPSWASTPWRTSAGCSPPSRPAARDLPTPAARSWSPSPPAATRPSCWPARRAPSSSAAPSPGEAPARALDRGRGPARRPPRRRPVGRRDGPARRRPGGLAARPRRSGREPGRRLEAALAHSRPRQHRAATVPRAVLDGGAAVAGGRHPGPGLRTGGRRAPRGRRVGRPRARCGGTPSPSPRRSSGGPPGRRASMPTDPRRLRGDAPLLDAWLRFHEDAADAVHDPRPQAAPRPRRRRRRRRRAPLRRARHDEALPRRRSPRPRRGPPGSGAPTSAASPSAARPTATRRSRSPSAAPATGSSWPAPCTGRCCSASCSAGLEPVWVRPEVDPDPRPAHGRDRQAPSRPRSPAPPTPGPSSSATRPTSARSVTWGRWRRWRTGTASRSSSTRPGAPTSASTRRCRRTRSRPGADALVTSAHKALPAWSQGALVLARTGGSAGPGSTPASRRPPRRARRARSSRASTPPGPCSSATARRCSARSSRPWPPPEPAWRGCPASSCSTGRRSTPCASPSCCPAPEPTATPSRPTSSPGGCRSRWPTATPSSRW